MTMWELAVCIDGVNASNSVEVDDLQPPTNEEFDKMLEEYDHLRAPVQ